MPCFSSYLFSNHSFSKYFLRLLLGVPFLRLHAFQAFLLFQLLPGSSHLPPVPVAPSSIIDSLVFVYLVCMNTTLSASPSMTTCWSPRSNPLCIACKRASASAANAVGPIEVYFGNTMVRWFPTFAVTFLP
ncbi:Putative arginine N-methyltransferase 10 [Gossypium arboreum]|uniref:Putative arginine N-methyltransferase 10 n=2 Tax=Gossypium arboreum TaxID=29729 RepID=A0A0B0PL38_GOSAR|nr:uncharacterized protein LOC108452575 isoform X1 [Gossypium arboreum]KHG25144.1 Putative arginine N-methyltransferase 10 [Gossypium arboreum]